MIYAVIKDSKVISFLLQEEQQAFLQQEDPEISFAALDAELGGDNPLMPRDCVVNEDGTVSIISE